MIVLISQFYPLLFSFLLEGAFIDAVLIFDFKELWRFIRVTIEDNGKFLGFLFDGISDMSKQKIIELLIFEEHTGDNSEDILWIGNQKICSFIHIPESRCVVVIFHCIPKYH